MIDVPEQPVSAPGASVPADSVAPLREIRKAFEAARDEIRKVIVGQDDCIDCLLVAALSGGHVLLTGVPGLGRTLLVKAVGRVLGLTCHRIQFTPDLLPTDITGSEVLEQTDAQGRRFRFFKGPVFCNLLLADEINRSPARTQAALLEAMHEHQVTVGGRTFPLPDPFLVVATKNSMETEGVWRMPEAQIDRFMLMVELPYPDEEGEVELLRRTTGADARQLATVLDPATLVRMRQLALRVPVVPAVKRFAVDIVRASRPGAGAPADLEPVIRLGASPRAAQCLLRGAKVLALLQDRTHVTREDVRRMAVPVLAHRLMLDFRAVSRGVKTREVVARIVAEADAKRLPGDLYRYNRRHVLRRPQAPDAREADDGQGRAPAAGRGATTEKRGGS